MGEQENAQGPATDPAPPPSPREMIQKALDQLNHPTNLDLQSRLHAIEQFLRVLGQQLIPHLPE